MTRLLRRAALVITAAVAPASAVHAQYQWPPLASQRSAMSAPRPIRRVPPSLDLLTVPQIPSHWDRGELSSSDPLPVAAPKTIARPPANAPKATISPAIAGDVETTPTETPSKPSVLPAAVKDTPKLVVPAAPIKPAKESKPPVAEAAKPKKTEVSAELPARAAIQDAAKPVESKKTEVTAEPRAKVIVQDAAESPRTDGSGANLRALEERIKAVCRDKARQVRVVGQGDGSVRVRVTAESDTVGKQLLDKLTEISELASPEIRLEVYVAP